MKKLKINKKVVSKLDTLDQIRPLSSGLKPIRTHKECGSLLNCTAKGCANLTNKCGTIKICNTLRNCPTAICPTETIKCPELTAKCPKLTINCLDRLQGTSIN